MSAALAVAFASAAWLGCATSAQASRADWLEAHAELRALRERTAELEGRLAKLEDRSLAKRLSGNGASVATVNEPLPTLTVVKLKPKRESAPPVDTRVPVQEPAAESVETIASAAGAGNEGNGNEGATEDPAILEVKYQEAVGALRVGNVDGGVTALEQFAEKHPKHSRADNALYFASVGRMGLQDFAGAAKVLEELLHRYPAGDAVQDGMLKLAECRVRLRRNAEAKTLYAKIVATYPGTAAANQAEQQLSMLSR